MKLRLAILFDNFGPYHLARLRASASLFEVLAVEFARCSGEYAWQTFPTRDEPFQRVTLHSTGTHRHADARKICRLLNTQLSSFGPDMVAIPGWSCRYAFAALDWCVNTGTPAIVMSESSEQDKMRSRWKEWIKCRYISLCSAAFAGGRMHSEYLTALGLANDRIFLGYDVVDNEYFRTEAARLRDQRAKVRIESRLPEHFFLASGRFIEKKNLRRLINAYARYRSMAKSKPWDLVLLGDGPLRVAISSQIEALGLHAWVHLPGFKQYKELPVYYGLAAAFVHASSAEQWGLVTNEAMASGLPVLISNRCGCAPDLVQESVNGFTFDPYNVESLAWLMLEVSRLETDRLALMGEASRRISADWGPERFASGLAAAAGCALRIGPKKASLLDRLLLRVLMVRKSYCFA